jgi:hypothetical protein
LLAMTLASGVLPRPPKALLPLSLTLRPSPPLFISFVAASDKLGNLFPFSGRVGREPS